MALKTQLSPVDYLHSLIYFEQLEPSAVAYLADRLVRRTYAAGALIFMEGDPANGMWMIEAGRVKVYKLSQEGGEHVLHCWAKAIPSTTLPPSIAAATGQCRGAGGRCPLVLAVGCLEEAILDDAAWPCV